MLGNRTKRTLMPQFLRFSWKVDQSQFIQNSSTFQQCSHLQNVSPRFKTPVAFRTFCFVQNMFSFSEVSPSKNVLIFPKQLTILKHCPHLEVYDSNSSLAQTRKHLRSRRTQIIHADIHSMKYFQRHTLTCVSDKVHIKGRPQCLLNVSTNRAWAPTHTCACHVCVCAS